MNFFHCFLNIVTALSWPSHALITADSLDVIVTCHNFLHHSSINNLLALYQYWTNYIFASTKSFPIENLFCSFQNLFDHLIRQLMVCCVWQFLITHHYFLMTVFTYVVAMFHNHAITLPIHIC